MDYPMEEAAIDMLNELTVPNHLQLLLSIYGVTYVEDLIEFGGEEIDGLEAAIQEGRFDSFADFTSSQNRIKYFGSDISETKQFTLAKQDRDTLMAISGAVSERLPSAAQRLAEQCEAR
jgi:hypothetical protein